MIGETILHYKILEKLGEGGMGVVYLAEDTKLERKVAIKFLPHYISINSEERERFKIEAKAAAALNHPNIATIHAIEESEDPPGVGQLFIVMEYIDGFELKDKIKVGRVPVEETNKIAIQIAEGLEAAHKKGIVHRDIKSSNIMITKDGKIKIMDFGLAKIKGGSEVTKIGSTVGTVAYMSPEQAKGEAVDNRTDIWSFGVVLYEMLTRQMPFKGEYDPAVLYSILNEEPEMKNSVSGELNSIITKTLAKNPDDRYQSCKDLLSVLQLLVHRGESATSSYSSGIIKKIEVSNRIKIITGILAVFVIALIVFLLFNEDERKIESLAILPFVNTSGSEDTEYLSDGVTVSLINRLAEFSDLKVMSRLSVARFKDDTEDPLAAGRLMGVNSVVAGQLDLRGDKLIVDVDLLKVDDGQQLWGERFERNPKDILTIEHDIVNRISDKLKVKLISNKQANYGDDLSLDPLAYDNYLRGRYIMLGTSDDGPARAQEYFRQAIEREPRLAIAYAGLGESYVNQAWLNSRDRDEIVPLAKTALRKAMDLDPGLCEAHVLEGDIAFYFDWDWSAAEISYRSAMELNPGSDLAHREYSNFLLAMGYPDKAIVEAQIAQSLDPLSVYATHQLGWCLLAEGRFSEAVIEFRKAIDLNPTWVWGNIKMGMAYALKGEQDNATSAMLRADELLAGRLPSPLAQDWLAQIAYMCGDTVRIDETVKRLQNQTELTYVEPFVLADIFYRLGNFDKMFEYLEQGLKERSSLMPLILLQGKSDWKNINSDPRYLSLLKRMGFPNVIF